MSTINVIQVEDNPDPWKDHERMLREMGFLTPEPRLFVTFTSGDTTGEIPGGGEGSEVWL